MINIANSFAFLLPLISFLYLLIARIKLLLIDKKVLNNIAIYASLIPFLIFLIDFFAFKEEINIFDETIFDYDNIILNFVFSINSSNIKLLLYASFIFILLAIYLKLYFKNKKQYIFTKQRYILFLLFIISNTYLYLISNNMITTYILWVIQGIVIFLFSYFDISKVPTKSNIARFYNINLIGDFAFLTAVLILYKYEAISQSYITTTSLNFNEFDLLISYIYGISSTIEFKLIILSLLIAIITKFIIFPFSCYYSFLSNSSNIIFLPIYIVNNIFGYFLIDKLCLFLNLTAHLKNYISIYMIISLAIMLLLLLFEKNIKIIFGYLAIIINSIFIYLYINIDTETAQLSYFIIYIPIIITLMFLFYKDISNFPRRIINKQQGFIIERIYIFFFEKMPTILFVIIDFIKNKFLDRIISFPSLFFNLISNFLILKFERVEKTNIAKYIILTFATFVLIVIIIALFGEFK